MMSKTYVDVYNARSEAYRAELDQIQRDGYCPFCPEHYDKHNKNTILYRKDGWIVKYVDYPYPDTSHHFMFIAERHLESIMHLSEREWRGLQYACRWVMQTYKIDGCGVALRSGDTRLTGATVKHLHGHIIVPELDEVSGRAKPVSFPIG